MDPAAGPDTLKRKRSGVEIDAARARARAAKKQKKAVKKGDKLARSQQGKYANKTKDPSKYTKEGREVKKLEQTWARSKGLPRYAKPPPGIDLQKQIDTAKEKPVSASKVKRLLLQGTVPKWEKLRRHDTSGSERTELISALLDEAKGQLAQLTASHTGARVVQACAKHGSPQDRKQLLQEIMPQLLDLAKSPYGHFTVVKLIQLVSKGELAGLLKVFQGHVAFLLRHPCGAPVIDALYDRADTRQRDAMAAEFYGKEYTVLTQGPAPTSLQQVLKMADAPKQRQILQRLALHLTPLMEKGMVDAVLTHRMLAEYMAAAAPGAVAEAAELLAGQALLRMVHTRHGAYVGCAVLTYGTPKDRKKAIKAMKGHVPTMAQDDWAYVVLMAAMHVTDDTQLLNKVIMPELVANLEAYAQHKSAHNIYLQLLDPLSRRLLPPDAIRLLSLPQRTISRGLQERSSEAPAAAGASSGDDDDSAAPAPMELDPHAQAIQQALGGSKKNGEVRRRELLGSGAGSLAEALTGACSEHAGTWLRQANSCDVVGSVARGGSGGVMVDLDSAGVAAVQDAIVAEAAVLTKSSKKAAHVLEDWHSTRALKALVKHASDDGSSGRAVQQFCVKLWSGVILPRVNHWVSNLHARKVTNAMFEGPLEIQEAEFVRLKAAHAAKRAK